MSQQNPTVREATDYSKNFIKNGDKTKAFKAAFPKSKAKQKSMYEKACILHKHIKIQSRIEELNTAAKKSGDDEWCLTVTERHKLLAKTVQLSLSLKTDQFGNKIVIAPGAAVSAINEINKMCGDHKPFEMEVTGKNLVPWDIIEAGIDE